MIILYNDNRLRKGWWPVIIFLRIFAHSHIFDVFSLSEFPKDPSVYLDERGKGVSTVIITPSYTADVAAYCISKGGTSDHLCELAAYCAGVFMHEFRGLPNDTLDVETSKKIYKVVRGQKDGKSSVILPKCKVLYSNKREIIDETELAVSAVSFKDRIFKLVECVDAKHFSDVSLRALLRSCLGDSVDGVAAYSVEEGGAFVRYLLLDGRDECGGIFVLLTVAHAIFAKSCGMESLTLRTNKDAVSVRRFDDGLAICDERREIYVLSARDLV